MNDDKRHEQDKHYGITGLKYMKPSLNNSFITIWKDRKNIQ